MLDDAIGLARETVLLVEYTETWAACFRAERAEILRALGQLAVDVQHIGSTSVPGLLAKPIIDIAVGVRSLDDVEQAVPVLSALGYEYFGDREGTGEHFFAKGTDHRRTHYLHMAEIESRNWRDYLKFRDSLRADTVLREEYAELKRRLAAEYALCRKLYTDGKANFVRGVLRGDGVR